GRGLRDCAARTPKAPLEASMALEIRPNCEYCDKDLPAWSTEARICSYECTFRAACVESKLRDVCPNCGGGVAPRPVRPATGRGTARGRIGPAREGRPGSPLAKRPASTKRVHLSHSADGIAALAARVQGIAAKDR